MAGKRVLAVFMLVVWVLGILAAPAAAQRNAWFTGTMVAGKYATYCDHDGTADVSGAGIGVPVLNGLKRGIWSLSTSGGGLSVFNFPDKPNPGISTGHLNACGRLAPAGSRVAGGVGAACGMSKGYHGKGRFHLTGGPATGDVYSLHDLTWKLTAAGSLAFTASGQPGTMDKYESGADLVTGTIQAQGGFPCLQKSGSAESKTGGAQTFVVAGVFKIFHNAWRDPQEIAEGQQTPVICKDTGNTTCLYDSKSKQVPKR